MDVLPTLAALLHVPLDSVVTSGHVVDGASLVPLLTGRETVSPHEFLFHYCQDSVHAVRYRPRTGGFRYLLSSISVHEREREREYVCVCVCVCVRACLRICVCV